MSQCYLCTLGPEDGVQLKPKIFVDGDTGVSQSILLCQYCFDKYLDINRPGDKDFNGNIIPPSGFKMPERTEEQC